MIYPSIDLILDVIPSKYELVHIVAKRSKEMTKTGYYQLKDDGYKSKKDIGRALEEVHSDLIHKK